MDKLWAPWRINYISAKKQKKCIFCAAAKSGDEENTVFGTKYSVCILNIYPYNNGHLMVSPRRHAKDLNLLSDEEVLDLIKAVNKAKALLEKCLRPQGFNIGVNLSAVAGAGITGHLHIHIVPRWQGDTNFMPIIYGTKVISQSLKELRKKLKKCLKN
ncbi:MAG: HIT domain-containing protein [Candidatus Omnitrophica bacterium]|nr:HIT domain-containing protein [Candidatus Omnitrophota bacterium]MDD5512416.1 HIT domain-containing protein [Candidatus Omnitrophota bacterium]